MRLLLPATFAFGVLLTASAAQACAPVMILEPGAEPYPAASPRGWAREQDAWRAEASTVFLAQVSALRLLDQDEVAITLQPFHALYGTSSPNSSLTLTRDRGNTPATDRRSHSRISWWFTPPRRQARGGSSASRLSRNFRIAPPAPTPREIGRGVFPLPDYRD